MFSSGCCTTRLLKGERKKPNCIVNILILISWVNMTLVLFKNLTSWIFFSTKSFCSQKSFQKDQSHVSSFSDGPDVTWSHSRYQYLFNFKSHWLSPVKALLILESVWNTGESELFSISDLLPISISGTGRWTLSGFWAAGTFTLLSPDHISCPVMLAPTGYLLISGCFSLSLEQSRR